MQDKRNAMKITRDYFDSLLIEMRHLDSQVPHTELHLFGETFQTPIMMAALSHLQQVRENGMVLMAEAAKASNAVMWCGMGPEQELEDILATGAKTIKIIKPYADRDSIYGKIQHAADCGALAVGMDIDHQYNGSGHPDLVEGMQMAPVSTQELGEFVKSSPLPFVVKGVLSVQDAVKCMQVGASAIVLSHHNGIIPYAVPPLMVLPDIAKAVKGKMNRDRRRCL